MRIVETFNHDTSFWDEHIQLSTVGVFKSLYDSDRSRNKGTSSKMMWCIALIWDYNSKLYNLPESGPDSKIDLVFSDHYGSGTYYKNNKAKIDGLKELYLKIQETSAKRTLRQIEKKLEERSVFLNDTNYDLGLCNERGQWVGNTATILDKMLADTKKVYELYDHALKIVQSEIASADRVKGGGNLSLSDQEEI